MRIDSLTISNFRGITHAETGQVGDIVIIAGQNGSGKSCVFDAIRLLKSMYGGYQHNEWQNFFGEFSIQIQGLSQNVFGLFNDRSKPIRIEASFRLRESERVFIEGNVNSLLAQTVWQLLVPEAYQWGGFQSASLIQQFRERQPEVDARVQALLPTLLAEISQETIKGAVIIPPEGAITIQPSTLLSLVFSNYQPEFLGVVDFHGAQRNYGRENIQGINLNLGQSKRNYSQNILYNSQSKYSNIKSELASTYIKELLADKAGEADAGTSQSLIETLQDLFRTFFPDKSFVGPKPARDGSISFPVITQNGSEHDLDELSSGEKEIIYGYLRIRSSSPKNSIILIDEPELHLNPRLIRGLPEFYRRHLGQIFDNQLWLVTHSDALIREIVGNPAFSVYHMTPSGIDPAESSQLRLLNVKDDLSLALTDLVGDLAAYSPGGKCIVLEGGGDTDFDRRFISLIFSKKLHGVNLIAASSKSRVERLHDLLEKAYSEGHLSTKFYTIGDKDGNLTTPGIVAMRRYTWDVYHIENYLLDESLIAECLNALEMSDRHRPDSILQQLQASGREAVGFLLAHQLREYVNSKLVNAINLNSNPAKQRIGEELSYAAERSSQRIAKAVDDDLSIIKLQAKEIEQRAVLEHSFDDGSWRSILPGRDILRRFVSNLGTGLKYETLRNSIVSRMAEKGIQPSGMTSILQKVWDD